MGSITASGVRTLVFAAIGFLTGDTRFYLSSGLTGTTVATRPPSPPPTPRP